MVAFSSYRGNLHKAPDVPRRWRPPERRISLSNFKILLRRRAKAFTRLRSLASTSNPSGPGENSETFPTENAIKNDDLGNRVDDPCSHPELHSNGDDGEVRKAKDKKLVNWEDSARKLVDKVDAEENANKDGEPESSGNPLVPTSTTDTEASTSDVEKKKKEIQEKLEVLKEKKHGLVQVLKQILNAEEQLKNQNSGQGTPGRPLPPSQIDTSTDSISMMKLTTPRIGSDGNTCGDSELPQAYGTTAGVAGSPSQFATPSQVLLSVSVSGASHVTSSPSPAASSGGTSVFRDGRLSSSWN